MVAFDSNGGSAVSNQIVLPGGCAVQPVAPTMTGKTFAGWKRNGEAFSFSTPIMADTTLVASWT